MIPDRRRKNRLYPTKAVMQTPLGEPAAFGASSKTSKKKKRSPNRLPIPDRLLIKSQIAKQFSKPDAGLVVHDALTSIMDAIPDDFGEEPKKHKPIITGSKPDIVLEDKTDLFDIQSLMGEFQLSRTRMAKSIINHYIQNLSAEAAVEVASVTLKRSTNGAAELDLGPLRSINSQLFLLGYIRLMAGEAGVSPSDLDKIIAALSEKVWGRKPQAPVIVETSNNQAPSNRLAQVQSRGDSPSIPKAVKRVAAFNPYGNG